MYPAFLLLQKKDKKPRMANDIKNKLNDIF